MNHPYPVLGRLVLPTLVGCAQPGEVALCNLDGGATLEWVDAADAQQLLDTTGTWQPPAVCQQPTRGFDARPAASPSVTRTVDPPGVALSGVAFVGDTSLFPLPYGTVTIEGAPGAYAVTDLDGSWEIRGLPRETALTPKITFPNDLYSLLGLPPFATMHLATFKAEDDVGPLFFQSIPEYVIDDFADLLGVSLEAEACQVVTTVAVAEMGTIESFDEYFFPHGVAGVAVELSEAEASASPVYFSVDVVPDASLTETSIDGGVLWTNVTAGRSYVARVVDDDGDDDAFRGVNIDCQAGRFINASAPHSIIEAINSDSDSDSDSDD